MKLLDVDPPTLFSPPNVFDPLPAHPSEPNRKRRGRCTSTSVILQRITSFDLFAVVSPVCSIPFVAPIVSYLSFSTFSYIPFLSRACPDTV